MPQEKNQETKHSREQSEGIEQESYSALLRDIRVLIEQAQGRAYQAVDNIRVLSFWQIGERRVSP